MVETRPRTDSRSLKVVRVRGDLKRYADPRVTSIEPLGVMPLFD
jgi:hypothetical protein